MTKKTSKKRKPQATWWATLSDPLLQQILALLIVAVGVITLLALFQVTTGRWIDAWVNFLHYWLGWGAYPAAVTIWPTLPKIFGVHPANLIKQIATGGSVVIGFSNSWFLLFPCYSKIIGNTFENLPEIAPCI